MDRYVDSYDFYKGYDYEVNPDLVGNYVDIIFVILMTGLIILFVVLLVLQVLKVIGQWKMFKKAGEHGWKALIPIYNTYTLCELTGVTPWWILIKICAISVAALITPLSFLSLVISLYFHIIISFSIAQSYGKDDSYGFGVFFFPPIFYMVLGCDKSKYIGPCPVKDIVFTNMGNVYKQNTKTKASAEKNHQETEFVEEKVEEIKEETKERPNYCPKCGNKLAKSHKYCPNCGNEI